MHCVQCDQQYGENVVKFINTHGEVGWKHEKSLTSHANIKH